MTLSSMVMYCWLITASPVLAESGALPTAGADQLLHLARRLWLRFEKRADQHLAASGRCAQPSHLILKPGAPFCLRARQLDQLLHLQP
jgi:hypothetical protein